MSKCMTIDETIDQKDTFLEVTPKDIVGSVLEEILISVLTVSDKGCNRIGDFNVNEDFCQQYNQPLPVKDFEQANVNQTSATETLYCDKNKECSITGNETTAAGWRGETEERCKTADEYKVISDEILAGNELQIQNGQIHVEKIKSSLEFVREEYYQKEDVIKDEKIEIEYYNEGKVNKIYVPLNGTSKQSKSESLNNIQYETENDKEPAKDNRSPFKPFTTEELRQVWDSGNLSLLGKWDGDVANQREEIVKLLEGLSNIQVYPDDSADPNRPRTCSVAEEDVKKMIKEIEEINFIQGQDTVEDYPPDGQGDADLESKSFTKSKDILNKPRTESRLFPERSSDDIKKSQEKEVEIRQDLPLESESYIVKEPSIVNVPQTTPTSQTSEGYDGSQEDCSGNKVSNEELRLKLNRQSETSATEKQVKAEKFIMDDPLKSAAGTEDIKDVFSMAGSVDLLESQHRIFPQQEETAHSGSISGNDIFSEFTPSSDTGAGKLDITHSFTKASVSGKQHSPGDLEKMQNINSGSAQIIKTLSGRKGKFIPSDNYLETVEDEQRPFENKLNEGALQGNSSCSQSYKSNGENETQSKKSGSLKSQESVTSSESQTQEDESVKSESGKFNLYSKKMYSRMGYNSANNQNKNRILSGSEEALIESTEAVLQIIEPEESDEVEGAVLFSLMPQAPKETLEKSSAPCEEHYESDKDENAEDLPSSEIPREKIYSGMTTIGPIKNSDYDPKDLTAPDIDFGKMKQITSTRQLAKEFNLVRGELTGATTVKILEEIDSDESLTENDNFCVESVSLINRDIASLTKVQKVREVMSYQPSLEKDFEDEEGFRKHPLDLKDIESLTDDRYKVPDVGLPVLSVAVTSEVMETDPEAEKQLMERMGLFISGLTEPCYENLEENSESDENSNRLMENSETAEAEKEAQPENKIEEDKRQKDMDAPANIPEASKETESKYRTLSGVIRKGSSRFMKKDSDVLLRNSKSLPRDSSKIITTESIRSILDECSTSASNVLKRSQCMLRNTQSLFKTISQSRMGNDNTLEKHKMSPSESDISTVERKLSFLKKEDFAKAKNLIKSKMEKTFKRQESSHEIKVEQMEFPEEKKDLQVAIRNEEKLRVDRMENFKKWLPKSPLVYKSQFVKSQIKLKDRSPEADTGSSKEDENDISIGSESVTAVSAETVTVQEIPKEAGETFQQEQIEEDQATIIIKEETQPDYIVMETIEGLPISDLESPSSEKENMGTNEASREYETESDYHMNKSEAQKDLGSVFEEAETEEDIASPKISPQRKMMEKKKKLSTRLRNFWCSAFGRVKTPPKKSDVP